MPYLNYSMVHPYHRMNMFHGWFHIFLIITLIIFNCIQTNVLIQYDKMLWITQISGISYHYWILGCLHKMSLPPDAWANQRLSSKGPSRRCNFAPWNKGQCLMKHCSTLFQGVATFSNNVGLRELGAHRQLLARCRWGRMWEQCSTKQSCIVRINTTGIISTHHRVSL